MPQWHAHNLPHTWHRACPVLMPPSLFAAFAAIPEMAGYWARARRARNLLAVGPARADSRPVAAASSLPVRHADARPSNVYVGTPVACKPI